jgi:hypothetical protein
MRKNNRGFSVWHFAAEVTVKEFLPIGNNKFRRKKYTEKVNDCVRLFYTADTERDAYQEAIWVLFDWPYQRYKRKLPKSIIQLTGIKVLKVWEAKS